MQGPTSTTEKGIFNLSKEEILFIINALNGVRITIEIDQQWSSLIGNLIGASEYEKIPEGLIDKITALNFNQSMILWFMVCEFWNPVDGCYHIPDIDKRMREVGLLK